MRNSNRPNLVGRLAIAAIAVATTGMPALAALPAQQTDRPAATAQATQPEITKVVYRQSKGRLVITGTGLDEGVTVRVNGREIAGERKFVAAKNKLQITIPADQLGLQAKGQNRVEVQRGTAAAAEFSF